MTLEACGMHFNNSEEKFLSLTYGSQECIRTTPKKRLPGNVSDQCQKEYFFKYNIRYTNYLQEPFYVITTNFSKDEIHKHIISGDLDTNILNQPNSHLHNLKRILIE